MYVYIGNVFLFSNITTLSKNTLLELRILCPNNFESDHSLLAHNRNAYSAFIKVLVEF